MSIIIIFIVCLLLGSAIGIIMIYQGAGSAEILTIVLAASAAGAVAITTGLIQAIKQVEGILCPYGTLDNCPAYGYAIKNGFLTEKLK